MAKPKIKITVSLGKHIRREKGRIRRTVAGIEEQKKQIEQLYQVAGRKAE